MKVFRILTKIQLNKAATALLLLFGLLFTIYLSKTQLDAESGRDKLELARVHSKAVNQFETAISQYAAIVSGMRVYFNTADETPSAEKFQAFVSQQLEQINFEDSIVVSFIDSNQVFQYSFTKEKIDPAHLKDIPVSKLRSKDEINELNRMMENDGIQIFPPINAVEGWLGIPINFSVHRNGVVEGYVAPIFGFKPIVSSLYSNVTTEDFVFRFKAPTGYFDRESIHDGSISFNDKKDDEYHENFEVEDDHYITSKLTLFGGEFEISTAYKDANKINWGFQSMIFMSYLFLALFTILSLMQFNESKDLAESLAESNKALEKNQAEIQDQNQDLNKLVDTKNKFFSIIGHDIRGPLGNVHGLVSLLEADEIDKDERKNILALLSKSTDNAIKLLDNLLNWALSQTGGISFKPSSLKINELAEEIIDELIPLTDQKHIKISLETSETILSCDSNMVKTIMRNLISNAIKFTPHGGSIDIRIKSMADLVIFEVKDDGIGMPESTVNELFTLRTNASSSGTDGELGTGLGLILVKEFTDRHNGRIKVESELGKGTTISVAFPKTS